jgi:hypothetical protein
VELGGESGCSGDENDVAIFFGLSGTSKLSSPSFMPQVFRPILFGFSRCRTNGRPGPVSNLVGPMPGTGDFPNWRGRDIIGFLFSTAFKISRQLEAHRLTAPSPSSVSNRLSGAVVLHPRLK